MKAKKTEAKLQVKYIHLCDYFTVSSDGKPSIIGEFDRYFTSENQIVINRAFLVAKLIGQPGKMVDFTIRVRDPKGKDVFNTEFSFPADANGIAPFSFQLVNFVFNEFGLHKFQVLDGDLVAGETELSIEKIASQRPTAV